MNIDLTKETPELEILRLEIVRRATSWLTSTSDSSSMNYTIGIAMLEIANSINTILRPKPVSTPMPPL
jgi:hypothetical protein